MRVWPPGRWPFVAVMAIVGAVAIAAAVWLLGGRGGEAEHGAEIDTAYRDPDGIAGPRELDEQEAAEIAAYTSGPVLWLGEDFHGYRLTRFAIRSGFVSLIYGDCDAYKANPREPSCMPPLQMQLKPPGGLPPVAELKPNGDEEYRIFETRGVQVYEQSWNLVVQFGNGYTLTILNSIGDNAGLLAALQSANHDALGVPAAGPGEPLAAFTGAR